MYAALVAHTPLVRKEALRLRSEGASVLDIARKLNVSKASVSVWVRDVELTEEQRTKLDDRARNDKHYLKAARARSDASKARREVWREEADTLWGRWCFEPLFTLGLGIYWGEGSRGTFSVSNSDPSLLKAWVRWCHKYAPDCTLRLSVQVYPGTDVGRATSYWKEVLDLPDSTTNVSVFPERVVRASRRTLPNGVLQVALRKGNTEWLIKMLRWLEYA